MYLHNIVQYKPRVVQKYIYVSVYINIRSCSVYICNSKQNSVPLTTQNCCSNRCV